MEYEYKNLKPCINVFNEDHYGKILMRIVEVYRSGRKGVTFYDLYRKERILSSANMLKNVLDALVSCGYAMRVESSAETNSPWGRKNYIPTPLGVFVYQLLKLQSFIKDLLKDSISKKDLVSKGIMEENEIKKLVKELEEIHVLKEICTHIEEFLGYGFEAALYSTLYLFLNTSVPKNLVTGIKAIIHIIIPPLLRVVVFEVFLMDLLKAHLELREPHKEEELLRMYINSIYEHQLSKALGNLQIREHFLALLGYNSKECSEKGTNEDYYCMELLLIEDLKSAYNLLTEMLLRVYKERSLHLQTTSSMS
jgi:hypothetical protein